MSLDCFMRPWALARSLTCFALSVCAASNSSASLSSAISGSSSSNSSALCVIMYGPMTERRTVNAATAMECA